MSKPIIAFEKFEDYQRQLERYKFRLDLAFIELDKGKVARDSRKVEQAVKDITWYSMQIEKLSGELGLFAFDFSEKEGSR
jgi:hypothetical protein